MTLLLAFLIRQRTPLTSYHPSSSYSASFSGHFRTARPRAPADLPGWRQQGAETQERAPPQVQQQEQEWCMAHPRALPLPAQARVTPAPAWTPLEQASLTVLMWQAAPLLGKVQVGMETLVLGILSSWGRRPPPLAAPGKRQPRWQPPDPTRAAGTRQVSPAATGSARVLAHLPPLLLSQSSHRATDTPKYFAYCFRPLLAASVPFAETLEGVLDY